VTLGTWEIVPRVGLPGAQGMCGYGVVSGLHGLHVHLRDLEWLNADGGLVAQVIEVAGSAAGSAYVLRVCVAVGIGFVLDGEGALVVVHAVEGGEVFIRDGQARVINGEEAIWRRDLQHWFRRYMSDRFDCLASTARPWHISC
jgi:hypothetical protein